MMINVHYFLLRNAHEHPHKIALIFEQKRHTYKIFNERVNRLANALLKMGVNKGDKVAYLLPNCSEFAEISFALSKIGALSVPLNFRLRANELRYILDNADASFFFLWGRIQGGGPRADSPFGKSKEIDANWGKLGV